MGRTIADIADERGTDPLETVLAIVDEQNNQVSCVSHDRVGDHMRFFLGQRIGMVGSDGRAVSPWDGLALKVIGGSAES